eukprot:scaffold8600_cov111-Cylindrotheca_fusiformis.AAC.2
MFASTVEQDIVSSTTSIADESDVSYHHRSRDTSRSLSQQQSSKDIMPEFSGLSALIQAATSQLGQSSNNEDNNNMNGHGDPDHVHSSYIEGVPREEFVPEDGTELSFPDMLMTQLLDPKNVDTITFLPDGSYFALRTKSFSEGVMREVFELTSIDEFLELIQGWGFTRVCGSEDESSSGIQVFRHPCFRRGDLEGLKAMKYGQNPTEARMSAIPENLRTVQLSTSEDSSGCPSTKRRLSPSYTQRDTGDGLQKNQRVYEGDKVDGSKDLSSLRTPSLGNGSSEAPPSQLRRRSSTEIRSIALAVTTAELDLQSGESEDSHESNKAVTEGKSSLVEGGVERATHTIVTDAIETLLFDEGHTRETYLKHEKELSQSSLPGIVPISKQLFSSAAEGVGTSTMTHETTTESNEAITKRENKDC